MTRHRRTRVRGLCPCSKCRFPTHVHGTADMYVTGCECDYCGRAAETIRRLRDYLIRKAS